MVSRWKLVHPVRRHSFKDLTFSFNSDAGEATKMELYNSCVSHIRELSSSRLARLVYSCTFKGLYSLGPDFLLRLLQLDVTGPALCSLGSSIDLKKLEFDNLRYLRSLTLTKPLQLEEFSMKLKFLRDDNPVEHEIVSSIRDSFFSPDHLKSLTLVHGKADGQVAFVLLTTTRTMS